MVTAKRASLYDKHIKSGGRLCVSINTVNSKSLTRPMHRKKSDVISKGKQKTKNSIGIHASQECFVLSSKKSIFMGGFDEG